MPKEDLRAANISSVPQRSPFRYPGGKTWLVPHVRQWLRSQRARPSLLIEPFAGGGIVSLTSVAEGLVERALLVERDTSVAAVWEAIISGEADALGERILSFQMDEENVREALALIPQSCLDLAFQTILRNRVNRGGILAPGAGMLKAGERGKGLSSRWYPETLARRLSAIDDYRDRLSILERDGLEVITEHQHDPKAVFFIDPPYTAGGGKRAGSRLYTHSELDHELLFTLATEARGDILLTYDNDPDVLALARKHKLRTKTLAMKTTHHARLTELLIGRDLSWAKRPPQSQRKTPPDAL